MIANHGGTFYILATIRLDTHLHRCWRPLQRYRIGSGRRIRSGCSNIILRPAARRSAGQRYLYHHGRYHLRIYFAGRRRPRFSGRHRRENPAQETKRHHISRAACLLHFHRGLRHILRRLFRLSSDCRNRN